MADMTSLSDSQLDAAYAASYDLGDGPSTAAYGVEIVDRLASGLSFLEGAFGVTRFPLYTARKGFNQVDTAQSSIVQSANNVASTVGHWTLGIGLPLLLLAGTVFYFVYVKRK